MADFQFFDIILLAMVAGFIFLRLRSVLGRRMGHHRPPDERREAADDKIIPLPDKSRTAQGQPELANQSPLQTGLARIALADRGFDADRFVAGARAAYEMVVAAFARGDEAELRSLLNDEVFARFAKVIADREAAGQSHETTIIAQDQADPIEASLDGNHARISVKFQTQLVNVTRDRDGKVVAGDPERIERLTEIWTFEHDVKSRDPNWVLVATRVPH